MAAWYAIRTKPGTQSPHRDWWKQTEDDEGKPIKGHWRSSLNPIQSLVECELERAGIVHYMPVEYIVARSRRKTNLYETRRFAMLKGYAFVEAPDWYALAKVASVHDVVGNQGAPLAIPLGDILKLRMIELNSKIAADQHAAKMSVNVAKSAIAAQQSRKAAIKSARKKLFPSKRVKLLWGEHVGREATVEGWKDDGFVRVLLDRLDAAGEAATVPYEHLKAAE